MNESTSFPDEREALREVEARLLGLLSRVREALGTARPSLPVLRAPAPALIVLDAGHGGTDPGAKVEELGGLVVYEKDLALLYAVALGGVLGQLGYEVHQTRDGDETVGLSERAREANRVGGLCFVSLHANAASAEAANGAWVIHDDRTLAENGKALAECVFHHMSTVPGVGDRREDRDEVFADGTPWVGSRQLTVLSKTRMPAILVELGFMTNAEDLQQIKDPDARSNIVHAIAAGIIEWHEGRVTEDES